MNLKTIFPFITESLNHNISTLINKGRSRIGAPDARPPRLNFLGEFVFVNFDFIPRIHFNLCLQYVIYSLLSLQKHSVYVKGINTISRTQRLDTPRPLEFLDPPLIIWILSCSNGFVTSTSPGHPLNDANGCLYFDQNMPTHGLLLIHQIRPNHNRY